MLALVVDWFASMAVAIFILGGDGYFGEPGDPVPGLLTLTIYVLESTILTVLAGGSFGKLATRLRVVRTDGSGLPVSPLLALLRQVMVALVIPPLVFRPDGRGLHDIVAGTATVPLAVARGGRTSD